MRTFSRAGARRCSARGATGFTLIELVSVIVILGAIAAVALPVYRNLKYDARITSMSAIEAAIVANMQAAMAAYAVRGDAGPMTCFGEPTHSVWLNGAQVSVWPSGHEFYPGYGATPTGAPTACGMFVMLGCGDHAAGETADAALYAESPCAAIAGHAANLTSFQLRIWPRVTGNASQTNCVVFYTPTAGFAHTLDPHPVYGTRVGIRIFYPWTGWDEFGDLDPSSTCSN